MARSDRASEGERDLREENVRLRGAVLELRLLNDLAREIGASRDSAHVMATIVRKSMDALHAEQGVLTLLERGAGAPLGRTLVRATASSTDRPAFHVRDAVLGWMVLNKRPLIVNSPEEDERFSGVAWDPSVRSLLCAPLLARSELVGLITVYNKRPAGGFTAGDGRLLSIIAAQSAQVIENARLSEEERELERVKNELALAAEIQTRLLPKTQPDIEGYDIAGITVPAQEVGGDYFDFVPALNGGLAICLGDVSGKGLPAALLMAHLQAAVRSHVLTDARPARCLERCNALLAAGTDVDKFATCFHCVLDPREHVIAYANAGHERPIVISDRGEVRRLESGGTVLGFLDEVAYEEGRAELARGDVVVIFSDGVTDALNDQGEPFGEGRLIGLLRRGARDNARDVIDGTLDAVRMHSAGTPQTDDMTIVVIKRHGG